MVIPYFLTISHNFTKFNSWKGRAPVRCFDWSVFHTGICKIKCNGNSGKQRFVPQFYLRDFALDDEAEPLKMDLTIS